MGQETLLILATALIAAFAIGGVLYSIFFNRLENEKRQGDRMKSIARASGAKSAGSSKAEEANRRRKNVSDALEDFEKQQKDAIKNVKKPPLKTLLKQAGLKISVERFFIYSAVFGIGLGAAIFLNFGQPLLSLGAAFAGGVGLPRWVVGYLRKKRVEQFLQEFPNALDVIVRAIKSGLPLNDGLRLIANEAREPVRTEFQNIVESQQLGLSTPDACFRMYKSMPVEEANFFAVVIQIQQSAGGNLAEALGNLSNVLRARKQMKAKIAAMSMEAKASAWIIGLLPGTVMVLVYITSPGYIMPLFTDATGHVILACCAFWMAIGIFVMKQMINFEV
ncbi:MAG: type II secretion system F family protein [Pseudomonadota bacterium]